MQVKRWFSWLFVVLLQMIAYIVDISFHWPKNNFCFRRIRIWFSFTLKNEENWSTLNNHAHKKTVCHTFCEYVTILFGSHLAKIKLHLRKGPEPCGQIDFIFRAMMHGLYEKGKKKKSREKEANNNLRFHLDRMEYKYKLI